ncbi:MAG: hypothetical protein J5625_01230 [Lachnospiraceae bacterium]|nr:hypothetical protein [Lachnospiraceae bacterium]
MITQSFEYTSFGKADPVKELIATWGGLMISIAVFAVIFLIIWYNRNGAKRCAV